ncbi:MAG: 4-hydroxy-3-methylbut-2-enyl diphosphate reductase [Verrucomicrobia bacterium]|nr:4-hydroxy-3-methylbut-2-enyl diphosphate reductase [Verrucomicrobiota bacterium]
MQSAFEVIRAEHLGMCFGVRDAIVLAEEKAREGPLKILGQLVHNPQVTQRLEAMGAGTVHADESTGTQPVMITAHGVSDRMRQSLEKKGGKVWDATCPLVAQAHRWVRRLERDGFFPVIVGVSDHVEVRGLTEDLDDFRVVMNSEDVARLPEKHRYGFAAQTTQPTHRLLELAAFCRRTFPNADVRVIDTVCQPTKQRQMSAIQLACRCDVVVVIGGAHSNNTKELVATCREHCPQVYRVSTPEELDPLWFHEARVVGVTAGTSTPDDVVQLIERALRSFSGSPRPQK